MRGILNFMMVMSLVMVCACLRTAAQGTPVKEPVEATGILVKMIAVGAETTGWAIQFEDEVSFGGKGTHTIEIEGNVKNFGKLENKKVTVKGTVVHRPRAENKDRLVFVVQKIREWKAPAAERPSSY